MLIIMNVLSGLFVVSSAAWCYRFINEFSYFYADMKDEPSEITLHSTDNGFNQEGRCKVKVWECVYCISC